MKKIIASLFFTVTLISSASSSASFWEPKAPYLEGDFGGTTYQAQTGHQALISSIIIGGVNYQVEDSVYTRIQQSNSVDLLANGAIGFSINRLLRTALSVSYFKNTLNARNYSLFNSSTSYMPASTWLYTVNFYFDLKDFLNHAGNVNPYVGFGLGAATNHLAAQDTYVDNDSGPSLVSTTISESHTDFAYKFMAGISYELTKQLALNLEYAFVNAGNYIVGSGGYSGPGATYVYTQRGKFPIYANQFTGGLIYRFNA